MALGDESCDLRQQLLRWSRIHVGSASETYYFGMVTTIFFFFLFVTPISYSLWQQCYNPNFLFIYINVYFIVLCFYQNFIVLCYIEKLHIYILVIDLCMYIYYIYLFILGLHFRLHLFAPVYFSLNFHRCPDSCIRFKTFYKKKMHTL